MKRAVMLGVFGLASMGCAGQTSHVRSDTTLGRVVVYRNGVAYFERHARVDGPELLLAVPADKVDDFLKSLTVVDARTGQPAPVAYPSRSSASGTGLIDMKIALSGAAPHDLKISYVTEAPSWKPSYRVVLGKDGKVKVQAWAIVDNTSGEDWNNVKLGVGSSSALSFRYDLRSLRTVARETLHSDDLFAQAPPMGGATHASTNQEAQPRRVLVELSDATLAQVDASKDQAREGRAYKSSEPKVPQAQAPAGASGGLTGRGGGYGVGHGAGVATGGKAGYAGSPPADPAGIGNLARQLQSNKKPIVIEGYAGKEDGDKRVASLERANRLREELIRNGVSPEQVVAIGQGEASGRGPGVRIVEEQSPVATGALQGADGKKAAPGASEPIGTSHFESGTTMSVPRGTSAMVSILHTDTDGEVVYLYDAETPRGNASFPFKAVRIKNPTDSALESGPVTVFGDGRFIGEGLSDPIPPRSSAFVPFALDRQIVVERADAERDEIARILTVQRGVFSTEVQHTRKTTLTLVNRLPDKATVYVRHTVPPGYKLGKAPPAHERLGGAHLFRVEVGPGARTEVVIEESTPLLKTTDIRSPAGLELVKVYLSSATLEGPLRAQIAALLALQTEMANVDQQIATARDQMSEYRARMDELHAQLVTLKAVRTAGPLMRNLEKKLEEVSDRLSRSTIDLVGLQEKLMIARIRFQDGIADLSLEKTAATAATATAVAP